MKKAAPKENRDMIQSLIELYSSRKTPNYRSVENAVNRLAVKSKSKAVQAKALKVYEALTEKYKDALPTTGLWILEIQIAHPQLPYGAFYEDLLI